MRKSSVLLGIISIVCAVASIYLWRELSLERARNAELRALLEAPAPASVSLPATNATPPTSAAAPAASLTANAAPAAAPSPQEVTGTQEDWESYRRRLMRDPKFREVRHEQSRLELAPRRANLIRLLSFTPEQADAVIDLQIELEFQQADEPRNHATEELRLQARQRAEAREKEYETKLLEILGSDKQARLQHYMESRGSRVQVEAFRSQLNGADVLRDDQVEPLIEALHVERSQMREELRQYRDTLNWDGQATDTWQRFSERETKLMKEMHADMHSSAAAILSSSQLEELDAMLRLDLQEHEAQMRLSKIQSKLGNAKGAATQPN